MIVGVRRFFVCEMGGGVVRLDFGREENGAD